MTINSLSLHLLAQHPKIAARTLEQFPPEQLAGYLEQAPVNIAAEVIKHIIPSIATECLKIMPLEKSAPVVMQLGVERASVLLRRMRENIREQFIASTSPIFSNMARLVLRYPEGTVGQIMNPHVFTVRNDMTVAEVITAIQNSPELNHNEIFITGNTDRLCGVIELRQLLKSDYKQVIKDIMRPHGDTISARSSLGSIKPHADRDSRENFPVVDHHGVFIGVLNRITLYETLSGKVTAVQEYEHMATAMAVAELFWDACAGLLAPGEDTKPKGHEHE